MVAFKWAENRTPSLLARWICSVRKVFKAFADMNVESTISSLRTLRSSLSTVTLPAASVCRIVNVSLCDIVTDCSLEKKSSLSIVATLVLESFDHRSEEHTSELQSRGHLVCRLLLEKKKE